MLLRYVLGAVILLSFAGCEKFEYNPYGKASQTLPQGLNAKNIERLLSNERAGDDTITIIFSGDSQRFYDELEDLVAVSNSVPGVDFFVLAGDISDFGLVQEYKWIGRELESLRMPYICTIGNHDLLGKGLDLFRGMFGPENCSFHYKNYKFLLHDSNGREHNFNGAVPDMAWLSKEVEDSTADWFVGLSHVPPYDSDFDPALEEGYRQLMANTPGFKLSLHGHLHLASDNYYYHDGVRYIGSNAVGSREALLLKLIDGKVIKQTINY